MNAYVICGYGIPKEINNDENYRTYLNVAFNHIFSGSVGEQAVIIPCGGPASCEPPYEGTEAAVIGAYIEKMMRREVMGETAKDWRVVLEDRSLSTLENLLFANELVGDAERVIVFCDETRKDRVAAIAKKVFGVPTVVDPIDFDVSKNRYLDSDIIAKKEKAGTVEALWTLENPERLKLHHEFFEQKFAYFRERQAQGLSHVEVMEEWFTRGPEIMRELMPDHPLMKNG